MFVYFDKKKLLGSAEIGGSKLIFLEIVILMRDENEMGDFKNKTVQNLGSF